MRKKCRESYATYTSICSFMQSHKKLLLRSRKRAHGVFCIVKRKWKRKLIFMHWRGIDDERREQRHTHSQTLFITVAEEKNWHPPTVAEKEWSRSHACRGPRFLHHRRWRTENAKVTHSTDTKEKTQESHEDKEDPLFPHPCVCASATNGEGQRTPTFYPPQT